MAPLDDHDIYQSETVQLLPLFVLGNLSEEEIKIIILQDVINTLRLSISVEFSFVVYNLVIGNMCTKDFQFNKV